MSSPTLSTLPWVKFSTRPPGCDLFAAGPSDICERVRLRSEQDLHPVTGGGGPVGGVEEGQAGGAGRSHPEDLEGVAREAELGQAAGQPDCDLDLLETVEGQVAHHGAEDEEEAGVGGGHCAEALQALAGKITFFTYTSLSPLNPSPRTNS